MIYLLNYLEQPSEKINTCIVAEIVKLLNSIIQNNAIDLLFFLRAKPKYINLFINLSSCYPNISEIFAKLIAEDLSNN